MNDKGEIMVTIEVPMQYRGESKPLGEKIPAPEITRMLEEEKRKAQQKKPTGQ